MKTFGQYVGSDEIVALSNPTIINLLEFVKENGTVSMDDIYALGIDTNICISALVAKCVRLNFLSTTEKKGILQYCFSNKGFDRVYLELGHALHILNRAEGRPSILGSEQTLELFDQESILHVMFELKGFMHKETKKEQIEELVY